MILDQAIRKLSKSSTLTASEAASAMSQVLDGKASADEIKEFLTVLKDRPLQGAELRGFRDALIERAVKVDLGDRPVLDLVGTGGDKKGSFNISTVSALIVAGAGVRVAKHGNYSASSHCGSSNVLEALGVKFSNDSKILRSAIEAGNITYLHAPLFHPALKAVAPIRKELGFRTVFNLLGPLANPAQPKYKLLGVAAPELVSLYREALANVEGNFTIVHSTDGYDEVSLTAPVIISGADSEKRFTPEELGFSSTTERELSGGTTVDEAKEILLAILNNRGTKAQREVVLANSALALQLKEPNATLPECVALAEESLASGSALKSLNTLIEVTKDQ